MGMVVQHNISAMNANRYYGINNSGLSKSLEKLSSGYQINRAGDNAAGLAVSEKMRSQIGGLTQGVKNAQDGISMIQTYEGALTETDSILQRMKTLADQSANGTYQDDVDREAIQLEFNQLNDELDQIADTDYNGVVMLNGGQMADGTRADGYGKIDYSTAKRDAMQVGSVGDVVTSVADRDINAMTNATVTYTASVKADGSVEWTSSDKTNYDVTSNTNGGFVSGGVTVNVDTSKIVSGDTITLQFTAGAENRTATPATIGYSVETSEGVKASTGASGVVLEINATATSITSQSIANALNALNGLTVKTSYTAATDQAITGTSSNTTVNGVALSTIKDGNTADLMSLSDGSKLTITGDGKISHVATDGAVTTLATITSFGGVEQGSKAGSVTTKISVSLAKYSPDDNGSVKLIEPDSVSKSNSNDAATSTLTYTDNLTLQAGARTKDSVNFTFQYQSNGLGELKANMDCSSRENGLGTKNLSLLTQKDANAAIDKIDNAINKVSMVRATFGATQNRLEHKIDNMNVTKENITSAESRIRDTDVAEEMSNFTKNQILSQASQSMLAQANSLPQNVLQLLG
ncbi:MAG: flagellin [Oscillospiraceae bacterium]